MILSAGLLAGCDTMVLGGGDAGASGGGDSAESVTAGTDVTSSTGSGPSGHTTATTRRITPALASELCPYDCDFDDDTIILVLDSAAAACGTPLQRQYGSGIGWRVALSIPSDKQVVGVYDLSQADSGFAISYGYEASQGATAAAGGYGIGALGTLEIVAIDGLQMTIRTTGLTDGATFGGPGAETSFDSDGEYVTQPCE